MTGTRNPCLTQNLFGLAKLLAGIQWQSRPQNLKRHPTPLRCIQVAQDIGKNSIYRTQRTQLEHRSVPRLTMPNLVSFHITIVSQA